MEGTSLLVERRHFVLNKYSKMTYLQCFTWHLIMNRRKSAIEHIFFVMCSAKF